MVKPLTVTEFLRMVDTVLPRDPEGRLLGVTPRAESAGPHENVHVNSQPRCFHGSGADYLVVGGQLVTLLYVRVLSHCRLLQDTEHTSWCSTAGPCLSILYIMVCTS